MKEFWTNETEEALAKYVKTKDVVEKNKIFDDYLFTAFRKLIDGVLERYCVSVISDDVKLDTLSYLVLHIDRYKPHDKTSGKSYCSLLIRSWLADYRVKNAKQLKNVSIEDCDEDDFIK